MMIDFGDKKAAFFINVIPDEALNEDGYMEAESIDELVLKLSQCLLGVSSALICVELNKNEMIFGLKSNGVIRASVMQSKKESFNTAEDIRRIIAREDRTCNVAYLKKTHEENGKMYFSRDNVKG